MNAMTAEQQEERLKAALRNFVRDGEPLRQLEQHLSRFNVFEVLRSVDHELRHSNMLAWMFDPAANHGLGDRLLRRWLMEVYDAAEKDGFEMDLDPVDIDTTPFHTVQVYREWNHVDVVIDIGTKDHGQWVIAIENKVNAGQGDGQLARYRNALDAGFPQASKRLLVFLTKYGGSPEDEAFLPVRYDTVEKALAGALVELKGRIAPGPEYLLNEYHTILKDHFMANSENIDLAIRIYKQHKQALDFIFDNKPDLINEVTALLLAKLEEQGKALGIQPLYHNRGQLFFIPDSWDLAGNRTSDKWAKTRFILRFWDEKNTALLAQLGPEVEDLGDRTKVLDLANEKKFKHSSSKHKVPAQWFMFLKEPITGVTYAESDAHTLADDIWEKFMNKLKSSNYLEVRDSMVPILKQFPDTRGKGSGGEDQPPVLPD